MLSIFHAAAVVAPPVERASPTAATASARAVVRIVRSAEVRFGRSLQFEASISRETTLRERDGSTTAASLVEFY
jgi:hypothetical protein